MNTSGLSANPEKTNFVLFGPDQGKPILVGDTSLFASKGEKLVGVQVTSDLSWKLNLQEKEKELRGRIGILRRLSWHLPRQTMVKCINPIFTSKLTYGLELMADPEKHYNKDKAKCTIIARLQRLLNEAVRAALRLHKGEHITESELMRRGQQLSVARLAERALASQAWNALASQERQDNSDIAKRIERGQVTRVTRQRHEERFPPQSVSDSLVSRVCKMWNILPEDIRQERLKSSAKAKIKEMFVP